ncbi:MAG TPA: iron donor protein CyaY [Polyangiaceae bacterium]|nr:iron donor protein CyaY [Polyangiaceae bacterium]
MVAPFFSSDRSMISEAEYEALAAPELKLLLEALDALDSDGLEVELESDILTLEFSDDTRYVINSHRAARQIWMAAERAAWHFDWDPARGAWVASKTGDELWQTLSRTIGNKLGHPVELRRTA